MKYFSFVLLPFCRLCKIIWVRKRVKIKIDKQQQKYIYFIKNMYIIIFVYIHIMCIQACLIPKLKLIILLLSFSLSLNDYHSFSWRLLNIESALKECLRVGGWRSGWEKWSYDTSSGCCNVESDWYCSE